MLIVRFFPNNFTISDTNMKKLGGRLEDDVYIIKYHETHTV